MFDIQILNMTVTKFYMQLFSCLLTHLAHTCGLNQPTDLSLHSESCELEQCKHSERTTPPPLARKYKYTTTSLSLNRFLHLAANHISTQPHGAFSSHGQLGQQGLKRRSYTDSSNSRETSKNKTDIVKTNIVISHHVSSTYKENNRDPRCHKAHPARG